MMLGHSLGMEQEAQAIERAVNQAINAGHRTADLARPGETPLNTAEMTEAIVGAIQLTNQPEK